MIKRLIARGEAAARRQQRRRIERIVEELETQVAGVSARATPSGVVLSGRALVRRWLSDSALRFAGTLTR